MRPCSFISYLWRKKQLHSDVIKAFQINNILRCFYDDTRKLHSSYGFNRSPFNASQEVNNKAFVFPNSSIDASTQRCRLFSSASYQTNDYKAVQTGNKPTNTVEMNNAPQTELSDSKVNSGPTDVPQSVKRRRRGPKRTKFSDSDSDSDSEMGLSRDSLMKLLAKKEELLKKKQAEMMVLKDKTFRTLAENDSVIERTKREAENSKMFAIQSFAKSLLDVADNLGRASLVVKDKFTQNDIYEDPAGALPLLKTLLEGVEMTEKQLTEVFKKFGVERYDPMNEEFDPNRHNAVFQVADESKPPNTVAVVMKPGYTLHDRVIRPAEVAVVTNVCSKNKETEKD